MALKPVDMNECSQKSRCCDGPNAGRIYSNSEPCYPGCKFVPDQCDCDCNILYVYVIDSDNNSNFSDGPQETRIMTLESFFNQNGEYVEQRFAISTNTTWESNVCDSTSSVFDCQNFQGTITATKENVCYGGSSAWVEWVKVYYIDGEYDRFDYFSEGGFARSAGGSQCGAPVGTTSSITIAIRGPEIP